METRLNTNGRSEPKVMPVDTSWGRGAEADDESSELNLTQAILGHKLLLIFFAALGTALGYLHYVKTPPVYSSSARLRLIHTMPVLGVDGMYDRLTQRSPIDTQVVLITSPIVLNRAVDKLNSENLADSHKASVGTILSGLLAFPSQDSDEIVDLRFQGNDPEDCRRILNSVLAAYIDYLSDSQGSSAQRMFELITQAKDELLQDLSEKEGAYAKFRDEASLLWSGDNGKNIHADRLAGIETRRAEIMLERTMLESQLKSIQMLLARGENREAIILMIDQLARKNNPGESTVSTPSVSLAQELMPLLLEEQLLLERFGSGHPKIKEIQKRIEVSRSLLESSNPGIDSSAPKARPDMLTVYIDSLKHEIETYEEKLSKLNTLFDDQAVSAKKLSVEENQSRALQDDLARTKQVFETVLKKLQSMELTKDTGTLSVEPVVLPNTGHQIAPNFTKSLALGAAGGIFIGILIGTMLEMSDRSYRTPNDISRHLNVPVIGHIPAQQVTKMKARSECQNVDPSVIAIHRPGSGMTESFRTIRTALMLGMSGGHQIIQVTSPNPGDGKSTLSANLAVTIANSGKRCLLLECDLRRPKVHKLFGAENKVGLSSVISHEVEFSDAVQSTTVENLDLLTCGPRVKNPGELFLKPEFSQLLEMLRDRYDIVIVDSPPILAVSDSATVSTMVDGVVLVTRVGRKSRPMLSRVHETLSIVGANILGVVVNGVGGDRSSYGGSYSRYSASYGYQYGRYGKYSQYHDESAENGVQHQRV